MNFCDLQILTEPFEKLLSAGYWSGLSDQIFSGPMTEGLITAGTSFSLIAAAEIGDKSQVVCMTLAARYHRAGPVLMGAMVAFAFLNVLAVVFGMVVSLLTARWM